MNVYEVTVPVIGQVVVVVEAKSKDDAGAKALKCDDFRYARVDRCRPLTTLKRLPSPLAIAVRLLPTDHVEAAE